jgi:hypothetical protein
MTNDVVIKQDPQLAKISNYFDNEGIVDFFVQTCGFTPEVVRREAIAFATKTAMHDLTESKPDKKLATCSAISKQQVFMNLLKWGLPTDARDLYYLYNTNGNMTCEPSYKGLKFIAEKNGLKTHEGLIFEGDEFVLSESSKGDSYEIKRADPFKRKNIKGCFVQIMSEFETRVYTYSFEELEASRQASIKKMYGKESPAWQSFKNDMYLKCGVRKALNIAMSKISTNSNIQALFNDEMEELPPQPQQVQSLKTSEFASIEYDMTEAEKIDEDFKQTQFEQLKAQFDYRSEE